MKSNPTCRAYSTRTSDLEGSAGVYRLKEDLQRRINAAIYPATVTNVLFKEILIQ
jgi:flagellar FliL protein